MNWYIALSLLSLLSLVNLIFIPAIRKAGFSPWWVILSFVPIVNIVVLWVFAFSKWPSYPSQSARSPANMDNTSGSSPELKTRTDIGLILSVLFIFVILVVFVAYRFNLIHQRVDDAIMPYSQFLNAVNDGLVKQVTINGKTIHGTLALGNRFTTYTPFDPHLIDDLLKNKVEIIVLPESDQNNIWLIIYVQILFLVGVLLVGLILGTIFSPRRML